MSAPTRAPAPPAAPPPGVALAVTSLIGGTVAVLGCWIPVLRLGGLVLGLIAGAVGVVALHLVRRGRARGRGLAVAGVVTSSVAVVVAASVTVAMVLAHGGVGGVRDSFLLGAREGAIAARSDLFAGPAAALGVQEPVGDLLVTVTSAGTIESTEVDAVTGGVLSQVDHVLMDVTVANAAPVTADPGWDLLFVVLGGDGRVTLGEACLDLVPPVPEAFSNLAPGATVVVPVCFDIAPHAVPGSRVGISSDRVGEGSMKSWELQPAG